MGPGLLPHALRRAGAAILVACASGAASATVVVAAQDESPGLRMERTQHFLRAWAAAGEERREGAVRVLVAARSPTAPLGRRPSLADLARAARVLRGLSEEGAAPDLLAEFADAIDLTVVPGAFDTHVPGEDEARGQPLVVGVKAVFPRRIDGDVLLSLLWLGPEGEEVRARTEPFSGASFEGRGFPMYVRAPLSPPGVWRLVAEVEHDERRVRGVPVSVECVADAAARRAALGPRARGPEGADLAGLFDVGARLSGALTVEGLLRRLEGVARGVPPARPVHELAPPLSPWERPTSAPLSRAVLVVVAPHGEPPSGLFAAPLGSIWGRVADGHGLDLVSIALPDTAGDALVELVADLRAAEPERRVVLVARGDAASTLHLALLGRELAVDGLVLCAPLAGPGPTLPAVPTLLVGPVPPSQESARRTAIRYRRGHPLSLLDELDLPDIVGDWFEGSFPEGPNEDND